jgi:sirohydrochlorin cobaltochelatase
MCSAQLTSGSNSRRSGLEELLLSQLQPIGPAVILFAHGARDPRWAEPFLRVVAAVRASAPDLAVELAYLEHLEPRLLEAARGLAAKGARTIRVVPLFFGRGGHLRVEVPRLVAEAEAALTGVKVELGLAAGDDPAVIEALAAFCVRAARGG